MAAQGSVWKRCTHDGKTRDTGKPATSRRPPIPACRCQGGSWWWRIDAGNDPVTGERRQPTRGGYRTKQLAEEGLNEARDLIRRGIVSHDKGHTVATWALQWLKDGTWEATTRDCYQRDTDTYIIPLLGQIRLRDLQRPHVAGFLAALAEPDPTRASRAGRHGGSAVVQRSPATIDKIRRTLRTCLAAALEDGYIGSNPAAGRFRQIGRRTPQAASWWQPRQLQAFLDTVTDDPDIALWTLIALTGLRRSEALGLRWTDLDLTSEHPGLWIRQRCTSLRGPHTCPSCGKTHTGRFLQPDAKSDAGVRWVPLVKLAVVELTAQLARITARKQELGDHWSDHGLVFPLDGGRRSRDLPGSPMRPGDVTKRHADLVKAAGLPKVKLHEMRHGAVSLLSAAGMPLEQIALIVGHSGTEVTKGVYLHGIQGQLSAGAQAAADLLQPPKP